MPANYVVWDRINVGWEANPSRQGLTPPAGLDRLYRLGLPREFQIPVGWNPDRDRPDQQQ